jgi:hypothetical protein
MSSEIRWEYSTIEHEWSLTEQDSSKLHNGDRIFVTRKYLSDGNDRAIRMKNSGLNGTVSCFYKEQSTIKV